jgi:hypothetical protein
MAGWQPAKVARCYNFEWKTRMKAPYNRLAGQRGRELAMAMTRKSSGVFTLSTKRGNSRGDVFLNFSLPNGQTAHVLDRRVYESALKKADTQVKKTLDDIRKRGGDAK